MSDKTKKDNSGGVVLPTAPGSNPSSYPGVNVPIEPGRHFMREDREDRIDPPGGSRVAPNGAVVEEPLNTIPEVEPPNKYTPDKEDLDLLIM